MPGCNAAHRQKSSKDGCWPSRARLPTRFNPGGEDQLEIFQEIGDERSQYYVLLNEGFVWFRQGDRDRALKLLKESLVLSWGKRRGTLERTMALIGLLGISTADGKPEEAARLLGIAEAWIEAKSIRFKGLRAEYAEYQRIFAQLRALLDESTFRRLSQEGREIATQGLDRILAYAPIQ